MKNNKILETLQLKKKDKETGIVLVFIASLLAFAAAIYGAFRIGKKKGERQASDEEKMLKPDAEKTASAPVVYRPAVSKPVYVVRPIQEKKRESRGQRFKRHMCAAAAAILVISMVGSGALQYAEPATVLAKESFTGIGKIVEEHADNGKPYKILDIVPADATYTLVDESDGSVVGTYTFNIGTLGYLVNGEAPLIDDLKTIFTNPANTEFYSYEMRKKLFDSVTAGSALNLTYQEAYPGVDFQSAPAGWTQIFGMTDASAAYVTYAAAPEDDEDEGESEESDIAVEGDAEVEEDVEPEVQASEALTYATGQQFRGRAIEFVSGDKTGYDYNLATTKTYARVRQGNDSAAVNEGYIHSSGGNYRVRFRPAGFADGQTGGYVFVKEIDDPSFTSWVYVLDGDGAYSPVSIVGDLVDVHYDISSGDKHKTEEGPKEEDQSENKKEDPEKPEGEQKPEGEEIPEGEQKPEGEEIPEGPSTPEGPDIPEGSEGSGGSDTPEGSEGSEGSGTPEGPSTPEGPDTPETPEASDTTPASDISTESEGLSVSSTGRNTDVRLNYFADTTAFSDGWNLLVNYGEDDFQNINWDEIMQEWARIRDENGFRTAVFRYEPNPDSGTQLYEIDAEDPINIPEGEDIPYPSDSYYWGGLELSSEPEESDDSGSLMSTLQTVEEGTISFPDLHASMSSEAVKYVYAGPGQGRFKLERDANGDELITIQGAPVYFRCAVGNDWLKQYVFSSLDGGDNPNSNFRIEVETVRADLLIDYSQVQEADLIFLESGNKNVVLNTSAMPMSYIMNSYEDMPDYAVGWILQKAADQTPMIVDYDITQSEVYYKDSNYQYLAKSLRKRDFAEFYEMNDDGKGNLLANLKTNISANEFPDYEGNNYVNQNVYVVGNAIPLVSGDFADKFDSEVGFRDVIEAIISEDITLPDDNQMKQWVSKARAIQYIINYAYGIIGDFSNLRILEIQPSANSQSDLHPDDPEDDGYKKIIWKTESMKTAGKPIISSKEAFEARIDTKSVAEFNGELEDINSVYDIVFIGLDGQRLNMSEDSDETRYNNEGLNGKVYHQGDDSGAGGGNFDANDITDQKMDVLFDYMAGGYPVLVENHFFKDGTAQDVNADDVVYDYITEDSNMARFLRAAVSDERYKNYIFTVNDATSDRFRARLRTSSPRIRLIDENGEETSALLRLELDENNEYHGQIRYEVYDSHDENKIFDRNTVVRVYVDYNYDGYYSPSEMKEFTEVDGLLDVKIDGVGPGLLPWKLEVSDGESSRRSSVQGYFEMVSPLVDGVRLLNEIKVLQITSKIDDKAVDLKYMFNKSNDSMLASYLHGAESALNAKWEFDSMTVADVLAGLNGDENQEGNEDYLKQWDVVVLTLNDADFSAVNDAVTRYVDNGRSLLVCGQNMDDQMSGLSRALLGLKDDRTFTYIGEQGVGTYHRYKGLNSNMYGPQSGLIAQNVNEGLIASYPYSIDESKFTIEKSLKAAPYQLDLENNLNTDADSTSFVTAWYTLGSNNTSGSAYGISPKDARNNYYCYSKGNVVYLAQSEYDYTYDSQNPSSANGEGAEECKLFVNALAAAYSAGFHNAHINIVAGFSSNMDIQTISIPFDEDWLLLSDGDPAMGIPGNTVDVYFKFNDNNFAVGNTTWHGFYYQVSEGGEPLYAGGKRVNAMSFTDETVLWTLDDNNRLVQVAVGDELKQGKTYRFEAPVIPLRNNTGLEDNDKANKADIYIVLKNTFTRNGTDYEITSVDSVSLNRARLFRLE